MKNKLAPIYRQVAVLSYQHREGGRYSYVKLLSLMRDLPDLLKEKEKISIIREQLNEALCHNFGVEQEKFFEIARRTILFVLRQNYRLNIVDQRQVLKSA